MKNLSKVDRYTVKVPMKVPNSVLTELLMGEGEMSIVPVGYDPKHPVGTGAFKFESFSPGMTSTFVRNPNYWRTGEPYVDTVVITDYSDETAQDNALLAGEIDCADQLSQSSIETAQGRRPGGQHLGRARLGALHDARRLPAVQRRARPPGHAAHRRSAADARGRLRRLRPARQRHLRHLGPPVRPLDPPACAGHRPGEVPLEAGRAREPDDDPRDRTDPCRRGRDGAGPQAAGHRSPA